MGFRYATCNIDQAAAFNMRNINIKDVFDFLIDEGCFPGFYGLPLLSPPGRSLTTS